MPTTRQRSAKRSTEDVGRPKRARRTGKLRGSLGSLPNMPVDVLLEIMMYLTPPDILHLARTTKTFRTFLMSRTAQHIWRAARMNVLELPDCPEHLSEPAYAHLAYDVFCHECLKPNVKTIFWALGVRYCPSCRGESLVKCLSSEYTCPLVELSIAPHSRVDRTKNYKTEHWHTPHASVRHEFDQMHKEEKEHHVEGIRTILKWARACEAWQSGIARSRENDMNKRRSNRLHAVVAKLSGLGWADELALMAPRYDRLAKHAPAREPKVLTDGIWQKIRDGVIEHMETIRRERIKRERKILLDHRYDVFGQVYGNWHKTQSDKSLLPRPIDLICRREELRELINKPDDIAVSAEHFEQLAGHFETWAEAWAEDCMTQLRQIIRDAPEYKDKIPEGVDPLSLASAAFSCSSCECNRKGRMPALFPDLLQHECLWPTRMMSYEDASRERGPIKTWPWSCELLSIGQSHKGLAEVIEACGQDPMTVTREEMDNLDPRLYCAVCEEYRGWQSRRIFGWSNTLAHYCSHAHVKKMRWVRAMFRPPWRTVTDPVELELARKLGDRLSKLWDDEDNVMFHLSTNYGLKVGEGCSRYYYLARGSLFSRERAVVLHPPSALELGILDKDQRRAVELGHAGIFDFDSPARAERISLEQ